MLPHYDAWPEPFSAFVALQAPKGGVILGIDEDTAAVGCNNAWQVHGRGRVTVWRGRHRERFRRGEAFRIDGAVDDDGVRAAPRSSSSPTLRDPLCQMTTERTLSGQLV